VQKSASFIALAQVYKQLNAPFGSFAMATLRASTKALGSNDAGDATYKSTEKRIQFLTARRDALAAEMKQLLNGAAFNGRAFSNARAFPLMVRGFILLNHANGLPH
jgi:cell division protein FtsB